MKVLVKTIPEGVHHNDTEVLVDTVTWELVVRPTNYHTNLWELRVPVDEIERGIADAKEQASRR